MLLTVAAYGRGLNGEFQFDDQHTIVVKHSIRHLDSFFTWSSVRDAIRAKRVFTDFTFALNYWMGGLVPFSFHLTNLGIHFVASLLVFFFTRRILAIGGAPRRDFLAASVAGLFALHPLQTQAVVHVSQRAESLASTLYLGSLLMLLRTERRGPSVAGVLLYVAAFVLFVLGLGSKVIVATLPAAYLLIGLLPGPLRDNPLASTRRRILLAVPFFAYAALTAALGLVGMKGEDSGFAVPSLPPGRYLLTQWHVLVTYLRLLVWPAGQHPDWDFPLAHDISDPAVLLSGLFLVALLGFTSVLYARRRSRSDAAGSTARLTAFGVAWFFLLLLPTSSVIPLADVLMEHRIYLASWGVFLAAAILAASQVHRLPWIPRLRVLGAALVCLCAGLVIATNVRVSTWRTKLALWSDCVAKSPGKARTHLGLGSALRLRGEADRAVEEFRIALDLAETEPRWIRQEIRGELCAALLALGRADDAVLVAKAGLAERSDESGLLGVLAMAQLQRRDLPAAAAAAESSVLAAKEQSLRDTPDNEVNAGRHPAASFRVLGLVRLAQGRQQDAAAAFEQAVASDPDEAQGRLLLALAYRSQGRLEQACELLRGRFDELQAQIADARTVCPER